ncbi:RNA recognition motif (RRM, RBD, or RNP domain), putative [Leishmania guyanensis]|uniref:RRM domain-containing protein n=1 Tax=Leishmania guyanensis TaxID=5670 RepID=A0A1E1J4U1_LEIGU|nr:hypothetical protein, conserved [Leishmania guyanensis]
MHKSFTGVNAPSTSQQQQVVPSVPPFARHHQVAKSSILDITATHDAYLSLLNAAQHCQPSSTYSGSSVAATSAKWKRTAFSHRCSTLQTPSHPPSSSGVQNLNSVSQQPAQQPHQHLHNATQQSHEHAGNIITPVLDLSSPLLQQQLKSSSAAILNGESPRVHFGSGPYSPFTQTEVNTAPQPPEPGHSIQPHYDSTSHHRLYHTANASSARHALQDPATLQQNQQHGLLEASDTWITATATIPPLPFTPSPIRSLTTITSPGSSCDVSGNVVPTLRAPISAPHVPGAALPMPSQSQAAHSVVSHSPQTGPPCSSTAYPSMHPILIGHSTLDRGTAAALQAATDKAHTSLHRLMDANAPEFSGTTYYLEAVHGGDSAGNHSAQLYPSFITMASRQLLPQQHYLQLAQQEQQRQQLAVKQKSAYTRLPAHDGQIGHFFTHTATAAIMSQTPPSMLSGVAPLTSLNSSAACAERIRALQQSSTEELSICRDQGSWHQLHAQQQQQQHQQLRPISALQPTTDARGITRRNRDRAVLFVGQLNYEATEADVSQVFSCYGKPLSVVVLKDKGKAAKKGGDGSATPHRKVGGSAFVTYGTTLEADTAIMALHGRYNAKDDDSENVDESKYLQVSYGQQTGMISRFGVMHAEKLHAEKPENPIPFLAADRRKGKS